MMIAARGPPVSTGSARSNPDCDRQSSCRPRWLQMTKVVSTLAKGCARPARNNGRHQGRSIRSFPKLRWERPRPPTCGTEACPLPRDTKYAAKRSVLAYEVSQIHHHPDVRPTFFRLKSWSAAVVVPVQMRPLPRGVKTYTCTVRPVRLAIHHAAHHFVPSPRSHCQPTRKNVSKRDPTFGPKGERCGLLVVKPCSELLLLVPSAAVSLAATGYRQGKANIYRLI